MTAQSAGTASQYLTFFVAGEEYGLGILEVTELVEYRPVTRVPSSPAWVKGVANVRGRVVPVVDLGCRFGFGETALSRWTCIVLVESGVDGALGTLGLLADRVSQVVELKAEDIQPPPAFGTRARRDYLRGVGRSGDHFVLLLDVKRVVEGEEELTALDATLAQAEVPPGEAG